jgi:hypothetical protein
LRLLPFIERINCKSEINFVDEMLCYLMLLMVDETVKVTVYWDVTYCSLVDVYHHFGGACCVSCFYKRFIATDSQTAGCYITEDRKLLD